MLLRRSKVGIIENIYRSNSSGRNSNRFFIFPTMNKRMNRYNNAYSFEYNQYKNKLMKSGIQRNFKEFIFTRIIYRIKIMIARQKIKKEKRSFIVSIYIIIKEMFIFFIYRFHHHIKVIEKNKYQLIIKVFVAESNASPL